MCVCVCVCVCVCGECSFPGDMWPERKMTGSCGGSQAVLCVGVVSVLLSQGLSSSSQLKPLFTSLEARGEGQLPEPPALQAGEAVLAWGQGDGAEQQDQWNNYLGLPGVKRALG